MKKCKSLLCITLALLVMLSAFGVVLTVSAAAGDKFYFQKPADWNDEIYVYWWSGSGAPSWPGVKMTKEGGDVYSFTATSSFSDFNINDGGAENVPNPHQTVDLKFPKDGQIGLIATSAGKNDYGNECWNLGWHPFDGLGVTVGASVESCDFVDSLKVKLSVTKADSGVYSLNGGTEVVFKSGDIVTIGEEGKAGDKFVLTLKAASGSDTAEKTYTYTKTDSPVGASIVYFDNSQFNWENVYCYTYGTKENGEWPGQAMSLDSKSGLYYITFDNAYKSQNIIFNDGQDGDLEGSEQYPEASGLKFQVGDCKLLSADLQWVDYGKPDSKPYGFAYVPDKTKFSKDYINVDIDLKNAVKGSYSVDGGTEFEYNKRTTISVGNGKIGNSEIILTLKAQAENGEVTVTTLTYYKTFKASESAFYSPTDGSTTKALKGNYATNPDMKLGKYSTSISVDGKVDDWDKCMLIAQGVANDDPRVYMPSAIHERSVDNYALYASWDDSNLYFMWEMANVSGVLGGNDIFSAQKPNGSIWNPGMPMFLLLSVDPQKHAEGKARELDAKTQVWVESDSVWGSGITFDTNVDTFIAFDSANTNGGAAIIPLDDEGFFNYTESVNIGRPTNDPGVLNRNGFEIAWDYGTLSDEIIGINGYGGSRQIGDTYSETSEWINFFDAGYKKDAGFIYEVKIPLEHLGIDKNYIETNGIGAMLVTTFGTSPMNTLPHDPCCLDNADQPYSFEPSTSHEKEDADKITVPLARIGALLSDTVITEIPLEVNFGADKAAAQNIGTEITLKAEVYGTDEKFEIEFYANDKALSSQGGNFAKWTPDAKGEYTLRVDVKTESGKFVSKEIVYNIGEAVDVIIPPETEPTEPSSPTKPSDNNDSTEPVIIGSDPAESGPSSSIPQQSDPQETDSTDITQGNDDLPIITIPSSEVSTASTDSSENIQGSSSAITVPIPSDEIMIGDADNNYKVNIKDATLIQKHAAKITEIAEAFINAADVNSDEKINVKDATAIQKFVANIPTDLPIGKYWSEIT